MKTVLRLIILALFLLALPLATLSAQDESPNPDDLSGVMIQNVRSGTLQMGDDTLHLTLAVASDYFTWVIDAPTRQAGRFDTWTTTLDWESSPEPLQAEAMIEGDGFLIYATLTNPNYNQTLSLLTFDVELNELFSLDVDDKGDPIMPESFGSVAVIITLDKDFADGLRAGLEVRLEGTRPLSFGDDTLFGNAYAWGD